MFNRRKRYLIKKKLQFKYLLFTLLAMFIPTVVFGGALYYLVWQTIASEFAIPEILAENLIPALNRVNMMLLISLPLVFLLMLIFSVFISHKIAGPVYRLEKELVEIANGDYSRRIKFRSDDELQEIADNINKLLENLCKSMPQT